jgi:predicted transcriptional regulator
MKSTDRYSDKVVEYIQHEYGTNTLTKIINSKSDYRYKSLNKVITAIIDLHELNNINIQNTATLIVKFLQTLPSDDWY